MAKKQEPLSKLAKAVRADQSGKDYLGRLGKRRPTYPYTEKTTRHSHGEGRVERVGARKVRATTTESERQGHYRRAEERRQRGFPHTKRK